MRALVRILIGGWLGWMLVPVAPPLLAQQIPAWRSPQASPSIENKSSVRIALKPKFECTKNVVELSDIADLHGSESVIQAIRPIPLGPAPANGGRQTWTQDDIRNLLVLRGIDEKLLRWAGEDACLVVRADPPTIDRTIQYTPSEPSQQILSAAQRAVSTAISAYLRTKSSDAALWTVLPAIEPEYAAPLFQRNAIKGVAGGIEPWTGTQQFDLLVKTAQGDRSIPVIAEVQLPLMVCGAVGPLAKGHVVAERDLKMVRLTPVMKADEQDCFVEAGSLIGKELRRSISTGQPFLRGDIGPARTIHPRDLVEIHVVAGAIVAQTAGRALQSGGIDEVIEVEVIGSKKRLAARIVSGNIVEAIAR